MRQALSRAWLGLVLVGFIASGCAQLNVDGRPYAVVSSHYHATEAGLEVLEAGGTAADAAIAVAAMLSVVEPWFSSVLGGGTWALYYEAETGRVTSLDGVGPIGSLASVEDYGSRAAEPGLHQSVVPGAWDGWMLWLDAYGVKELPELLAPAIERARAGYFLSGPMSAWLDREANLIAERPDTARIYLREGRVLNYGDTVYQLDLADTLTDLADAYDAARPLGRSQAIQAARDHVYRGPIAQAVVSASNAGGGYLTLEDFASFEAAIVSPIDIVYSEGVRVYQNPPNSQGITQLLAMNTLKAMDLGSLEPTDSLAVHLQVEALKLAFADRHVHVGDPARVDVPVEALLSDEHAARQRNRIAEDRALSWPTASGLSSPAMNLQGRERSEVGVEAVPGLDVATGTTTFHIVDRWGNAAAVTTSLGAQFLVIGDTGIHINNRMRFTALDEGDPNRLTPGFKVRHTSNPYLVMREGEPYILGGNTGADTQSQGQVQQALRVLEFGASAQEAISAPRFVSTGFPATTYPYAVAGQLQLERGWPEATVRGLVELGHDVVVGRGIFGTAHMLVVMEGEIDVGADPDYATSSGLSQR